MYSIPQRLGIETNEIEGALWQWACMLRSAIPGIVQSFDPVKQTCVVQPAIREYVMVPKNTPDHLQQTPNLNLLIPTSKAIPPIQDVPIVMFSCFGWSITLPITPGTECLLVFADTCIDGWWQNSGVQASWDKRRHDLSDGFALFGPWSQPFRKQNYSTDSMQIRSDDGTQYIDLSDTGIAITSPETSIESTVGDLGLTGNVVVTGNLHVSSGASGTFTSQSGQIITVEDGVIISIA